VLIRILGSAAGGGFPQWNCNCSNCRGARDGTLNARPRTQSSIALSADAERWVLFNASPDLHRQIQANTALQPRHAVRDTPIAAIVLVDGQIDHAAGLLLMRENGAPLQVYATAAVHGDLTTALPLLPVLDHYCGVDWREISLDGAALRIAALPGIEITALAVDGKPGPYSPYRNNPRAGDNIAFSFHDVASGRRAFYAPGLAAITPVVRAALESSHCVMVDGTFWQDEEMILAGVSTKRAADLGHLPQSGPGGMIEALKGLAAGTRRILIHINNTNPILVESGPERALLDACGIEVAFDGMEIRL
jgi:pyrroloquinoline quinone biosynthesis protein B